MKKIIIAILLLSGLLLNAEVINFLPSSDMYTDVEHQGTPNVVNELWVANYVPAGQFQRINIDFDIEEYLNSSFESAILNITRFYSCPSGGSTVVKIYPISEEWDEDNWNNYQHIAYHEDIYIECLLSGPGGNSIKEFNVDVTEVLNHVISNDYEFNGLVFIANNNQKFSKFYSKENSNSNYRPSLDITTNPVSNAIPEILDSKLRLTAYPNPFNPTTTIEFNNPDNRDTEVTIYNLRGRLIRRIDNVEVSGDKNRVVWGGIDRNNKQVSSGIYFCKVKLGALTRTQKLVLQK